MNCPICDNNKIEQVYSKLNQSITSDSQLVNGIVSNVICIKCGNVFNQEGSRNKILEFYKNEYKLMDASLDAEFKYFTNNESFSYSKWRLNLLTKNNTFSKNGKILDVGCGKGNFLYEFSEKFPLWELTGIEVSSSALKFAKKRLTKVKLIEGLFEPKKINQKFDLIVSLGVLEHVEKPVEFLKSVSECLDENGLIFFDVPNFKLNPVDLFVFDHLNHFTKETLLNLLRMCGLEPVKIIEFEDQLPLSIICKKTNKKISIINYYSFMKNLVKEHTLFINNIFDTYEKADKNYEKIGVFGLGIIIWAGIQNLKISKNKIVNFFDENDLLKNKEKNGIVVKDLNDLKKNSQIPIIFSINPCYFERVIEKLNNQKCNFFVPSNFDYYKKFF